MWEFLRSLSWFMQGLLGASIWFLVVLPIFYWSIISIWAEWGFWDFVKDRPVASWILFGMLASMGPLTLGSAFVCGAFVLFMAMGRLLVHMVYPKRN